MKKKLNLEKLRICTLSDKWWLASQNDLQMIVCLSQSRLVQVHELDYISWLIVALWVDGSSDLTVRNTKNSVTQSLLGLISLSDPFEPSHWKDQGEMCFCQFFLLSQAACQDGVSYQIQSLLQSHLKYFKERKTIGHYTLNMIWVGSNATACDAIT